jgi:ATP-dependent helicase YprA (DUF1998 family)
MSEQQNLDAVRSVYAAFGRADLEGILGVWIRKCPGGHRVRQTCRLAVATGALPKSASSSDFC